MIVLTTNYKDALVRVNEALVDRVTAWIEVPPPLPRVRLAWNPDNQVYRVYARVVVSLVELYQVYTEREHGIPKSFLRAYRVLKMGVEDAARLHVHMYVDTLNALAGLTGKTKPRETQRSLCMLPREELFFHPVNPVKGFMGSCVQLISCCCLAV